MPDIGVNRLTKDSQSYLIYKIGSTYYQQDTTNGGLISSSTLATMINNTMNGLDESGGRFLFKKGLYTVDVAGTGGDGVPYGIILPQNFTGNKCNIELIGEGWGTILKNAQANQKTIRDQNGAADGTFGDYVKIANMTIDGSKANNTAINGVTLLSMNRKSDVYFENLHVINSAWQGFGINGEGGRAEFAGYGSERAWFNNCLVEECNGNAIDSPCWYLRIHNCASIHNSIAESAGAGIAGLDFDGSTYCEISNFLSDGDFNGIVIGNTPAGRPSQAHRFTNITILNTRRDGFQNVGSYHTSLTNFYFDTIARHGIYMDSSSYENVISNGIISNCTTSGHGIFLDNSLKPQISNVHIKQIVPAGANGIYVESGCDNPIITNCHIEDIGNVGLFVNGALNAMIDNCRIHDVTTLDGLRIAGGANGANVSNCIISGARHGVAAAAASDLVFSGVRSFNNNQRGFNIFGSNRSVYLGCIAYDNGLSLTNTYDGFILDGDAGANGPSSSCIMIGCKAYDTRAGGSKTQRRGLTLTSFANDNIIAFCNFNDNSIAAVSNSGTNNTIRFTAGYTADLDYVDFAKITTPADPSAELGRFYLRTIDANNNGIFVKLKKGGVIVEAQVL